MTIQKYAFFVVGALLVAGLITSPSPSQGLREVTADEAGSLEGGACPFFNDAMCLNGQGVTTGCPISPFFQQNANGEYGCLPTGTTFCGINSTCTPTPRVAGLMSGCGG